MGGGVVLSLVDLAPQHVCSVEMISALGVQEYELTGAIGQTTRCMALNWWSYWERSMQPRN